MIINIRVSILEFNYIHDNQVSRSLPLSTLLRRVIFQRSLPSPTPPLNLEAYHQLSRVKSNLTQISNAVHGGKIVPFDLAPLAALAAKTDILRLALREPLPKPGEYHPAPCDAGPKTRRIRMRVSPAEAVDLRLQARLHGLSVSALIRKLVLDHRPPERRPAISAPTFKALYRYQWRLNALAHAINGRRLRSFDHQILVALNQSFDAVFRDLELPVEDS